MRRWLVLFALVAVVGAAYLMYEHVLADEGTAPMEFVDARPKRKRRPPQWKRPKRPVVPAPSPSVGDTTMAAAERDETPTSDERAYAWGDRFVEDAARWIANGGYVVTAIESLRLVLDGTLRDAEGVQAKGRLVVHLAPPDRFRLEWTSTGGTTTHLCTPEGRWSMDADGRGTELATAPNGAKSVAELEAMLERFGHLGDALTMGPWRGPDARHRFVGFKSGSGAYVGQWMKVVREHSTQAERTLWLAYERVGEDDVSATSPGIVRVAGTPTIEFHLQAWASSNRGPQRPTRVKMYALHPEGSDAPRLLLDATVERMQVNGPLDTELFEAPR